jgi:hypothetical protein
MTRKIRVDGSWVQRYRHYAFIAVSPGEFIREQDVSLLHSSIMDEV